MVPSLLVIFIILMHFACVCLEQEKVGDSLKSLEGMDCFAGTTSNSFSVTEGIWGEGEEGGTLDSKVLIHLYCNSI